MQNILHSVGEYLTPTLKTSNFLQTGRLTPEEFVAAGDYLVFKCPTWSWSGGEASRRRSFLPKDKQLLITRNVPSLLGLRGKHIIEEAETCGCDEDEDKEDFAWISAVAAQPGEISSSEDEIVSISGGEEELEMRELRLEDMTTPLESLPKNDNEEDEIPDLEDFEDDNNLIINDPSEFKPAPLQRKQTVLRTRTFDLSITYDKYYQTPRVWVAGYDEHGASLPPLRIFDDVSADHARKTVTIEEHPNLGLSMASIHPCKHAHVMKRIIRHMTAEKSEPPRVDQYLVIFLKFISTVLPTIDYDHTMSLEG